MLVVQGVLDGGIGGALFSLDEVGCGDTALAGWCEGSSKLGHRDMLCPNTCAVSWA